MADFSYWRMDADAYGTDPDHAPEDELSRAELLDRLDGHVIDTAIAVDDLEANAGVWTRLTSFAFYRAVYEAGAGLRIELDEEDDQADDGALPDAEGIRFRFPIYIRHILVRQIARATNRPDFSYGDLDEYSDEELANAAESYAPAGFGPGDRRSRAYLHLLAVALRHFQDEPEKVAATILVARMIAGTGKASK